MNDDIRLARRAGAGDRDAFELLVRRHTDGVWRYARSMLDDDFAAEEAVQDTFLRAARALADFRGEAALRTWLIAICRRACLDRLRRRYADVVPLDSVRERHTRPEPVELRVALQQALAGLPAEEREAFMAVHVLGYSREEAAQIAGVPASTLRSRVSRARSRLAAALTDPAAGTEWS